MYNFKEVEEGILKSWEQEKTLEKLRKKNAKGKNFYFLQGPPYTSGRIHIGQAWNNSIKDLVLRYKRMMGFNVWDRAGYDMHGLPTENAVKKELGLKDKEAIEKFGLAKFIKECIKFSSEKAKLMNKDLERLGVWMDFENAYWPITSDFIEGEWWFVKKAFEQKRLYKGKKIMHWCSDCETSLAKHELEYQTLKDDSIFLKFKTQDGRYLIIWTTTPWTIFFNLAIMANPDVNYVEIKVENEVWILAEDLVKNLMKLINKKYKIIDKFKGKRLKGLSYKHPFENEINYKTIKKNCKNIHTVILSKEYVNTESGSGLVHCAPGCGPEDYEVGKEYGIEAFNTIDEKGNFKDFFKGLKAKKDDDKFIEMFERKGILITKNPIEHEYATCWRCRKPVVFRTTEQWFLKIEDLIPKLLKFNENVKWQPKFTSKNYDLWIKNLKDNGITRQRYWGCPVPIWMCDKDGCGNIEVIGSLDELKKKSEGKIPEDLHKPLIDSVKLKCKKCKGSMSRIPDVIDVWIDSGTVSWNCLNYPKTKNNFDFFPADFILEATEQIRLWFSMLQMCSAVAFGKSAYKNVYCHGMIFDYQGIKMSKSLGNIISPYEITDKYGADVLRYYMCGIPAGENISFNWEDIKIKQRNLNILDNLSRFILDLRKQTKSNQNLDTEEKYIISRKNSTIKKVTDLMKNYRVDEIIKEIENLFLDLSRIYIKLTREKVSTKDAGKVLYAVENIYEDCLKMFSIVCPFITDYLYQKTFSLNSVHLCSWPKVDERKINKKIEEDIKNVLEVIEAGLAARDKAQLGLKWPLAKASITTKNRISNELKEIIKTQLNVKKLEIKSGKKILIKLDTKLSPELEAEGYARELSRKVQAFRKKLGLEKKDLVDTFIITDDKFKKILENQKNFLKERTNSKKLEIVTTSKERFKNKTDFKIKDKKGEIAISSHL
ncbi:MAG: isoleucine--tRNA ligase [Nanoarchaeota archaeon]|nr:isoleucine--tRNA ligase [Nanoarchaeota archaeon]MBU1027816.1 isoleucine--tRNA ligase [Nanoarchaeota archaeon]